jgi:type VI secretion system protein VasG
VPPPLQGVALHVLDLGLLQAGASVKGEFENRLKNVIDEVKKSPHPIILFIDEAHTMIGAGGQAGQNDAPTCSSRRWRAASCAPSPPPPGANTRSTSRRTPRWPAASRSSRSRSRARRWRRPCCAAWCR